MPPIRILLAEDNPDHQELVQLALNTGRCCEFETVRFQREFTQAVRTRTFDCAILDFNLADCSATDLLRTLGEEGIRCPALVISSSQEQAVVIESLRNGGADFIPKAEVFQGDMLWRRIDHALAAHRRTVKERRQIRRRIEQLSRLAETDPLTGLSNRLHVSRLMNDRRSASDRRGPTSLLMLDLDHFKRINDTYGHLFGDQVLQRIGDLLRECADPRDTTCRWGGEEFLILKPATSLAEALFWAERLREAVTGLQFRCDGDLVSVTVSVGLATRAEGNLDEALLRSCDEALYLAKRTGRDRTSTAEMVDFLSRVDSLSLAAEGDVEQRLRLLLDACRAYLGPTQYEHLSSHAEFVSQFASWLGETLSMERQDLERMRLAGLLHDLGKYLIPETVLAKRQPLTNEERLLLQRHASDGADMCRHLGADEHIAALIRQHHLRFEGLGRHGQGGDPRIPLGARILAVADAFVCMTSHRPYQRARSFTGAVRELQRCKGTQFDPAIVDAVPRALVSRAPLLQEHIDSDSKVPIC